MSLPPDDKSAKKHWKDQDAPLNRPFGSRDPGLVQVSSPEEVNQIITREADGDRVPVFKQRTSQNLHDPVARSQMLIRQFTEQRISPEKFMKQCQSVEDMSLFLALYGNMDDDKKAAIFLKLSKILFDAQKEAQKQNNIDRAREDRVIKNTLANQTKLQKMLDEGMLQATIVEDNSKDGGK